MFARILSIAAAVAFITGLLWQPPVRARQAAAQGPLPIIDTRDISTALTTPVGRQFVPGEVVVRRQPDAVLFTADQMGPIGLGPVVRTTSGGEVVYRVSVNIMRAMSAQERTYTGRFKQIRTIQGSRNNGTTSKTGRLLVIHLEASACRTFGIRTKGIVPLSSLYWTQAFCRGIPILSDRQT